MKFPWHNSTAEDIQDSRTEYVRHMHSEASSDAGISWSFAAGACAASLVWLLAFIFKGC